MVAFASVTTVGGWVAEWRQRLGSLAQQVPLLSDYHAFYRAWRRSPRHVGAMAPSGRALSKAITLHVAPRGGSTVLELGCGTGVFTRALLARGIPEQQLVLVEREPQFAARLREHFPRAQVFETDAAALHALPAWATPGTRPGVVICGLPLLNMGVREQMRVMQGAFSVLAPGGALYLFTYGIRSPLRPAVLHRLGLRATKQDTVWANVPPAHVWRLSRRPGEVAGAGRSTRTDPQPPQAAATAEIRVVPTPAHAVRHPDACANAQQPA